MLYYVKQGKNATETQSKTCAVYKEGAVEGWGEKAYNCNCITIKKKT